MRQGFSRVALALGVMALAASPAMATVKTKVNTKTYSISGKTGGDLLASMDRKGPKHGFLTRAIAQTSYTVDWQIDWTRAKGTCKVRKAVATLSITYSYPAVSTPVSATLAKRWARFLKGVHKHEEMHGTLARKMVGAADKAITGYTVKNDPTCSKAQAAVRKRVDEVYAAYEAKQYLFDQIEHQPGGNVEALVRALGN